MNEWKTERTERFVIQPRDQEAIKGDKGKGRGKRLGGPCWMCGGHTSRESAPPWEKCGPPCPITTAWTSWRPGSLPGPTPAQWNSWLPKPYQGKKARERAEAKEREEGATKEKKGTKVWTWCVSTMGMANWPHAVLGRWSRCVETVRTVTDEDEQGWKTVIGRKETNAPIETQIMMKEVNSGGTRFGVFEVTMNSEEDFRVPKADVQNGAAKRAQYNYEEGAQ